jgi:hypothetical protein
MPTPTIVAIKKKKSQLSPTEYLTQAIAPHIARIVDLSTLGYGDATLELNINISNKAQQVFKLNCQIFAAQILDVRKKLLFQQDTGLALPQGVAAKRHRTGILLSHCAERLEQWFSHYDEARTDFPVMCLRLFFKFHQASLASSCLSVFLEDRLMFPKPIGERSVKKIGQRDKGIQDFPITEAKLNFKNKAIASELFTAQTLKPFLVRGFDYLAQPGARRQQLEISPRDSLTLINLHHGLEFLESHSLKAQQLLATEESPQPLDALEQEELISLAAVVVANWIERKSRTQLTLLFEAGSTKIEHVDCFKI